MSGHADIDPENSDFRDKEIQSLKSALRESRSREIKTVRAAHRLAHRVETQLKRDLKKAIKLLNRTSIGAESLLKSRRWKFGTLFSGNKSYAPLLQPLAEFQEWLEDQKLDQLSQDASIADQLTEIDSTGIGSVSVDVVICVHDALEYVKECLPSVVVCSPRLGKLILVNDGSDKETSQWLKDFSESVDVPVEQIHNTVAKGYTMAANQGMMSSRADYVVLLNSDTIVPSNWLDALIACGESDKNIGIVGPLSNAASWQSVPNRFDEEDWAVNKLPRNMTCDQYSSRLQMVHKPNFPRVPLLNGFCLAIKREVFDAIGYFDEQHFPSGYGEENDFCIRATAAGFDLAIADTAYVYHAKSKSFTHERRRLLSKSASKVLYELHSEDKVKEACKLIERDEGLAAARAAAQEVEGMDPVFKMLFLLPPDGSGGGVHSIVQEASGLWKRGIYAQVAVKEYELGQYLKRYPQINRDIFYTYIADYQIVKYSHSFDAVIATMNTTTDLLHRIYYAVPNVILGYYIQDYEPSFYPEGSLEFRHARASYSKVPGAILFAKTEWLADKVRELHSKLVYKVIPSIDREIFYPSNRLKQDKKIICAMVRPETQRRSPALTAEILETIRIKYGEEVEVVAFGCKADLEFWDYHNFRGEKLGILSRDEVADLLRRSWLFLDLSTYQAFGRTGLEAMACGCATVLPKIGGVGEYAEDGKNCLMVDTGDKEEIMAAVDRMIVDEEFHDSLIREALDTAEKYSIERAAESIENLFLRAAQERKGISAISA